jgi:hypothetical protein
MQNGARCIPFCIFYFQDIRGGPRGEQFCLRQQYFSIIGFRFCALRAAKRKQEVGK